MKSQKTAPKKYRARYYAPLPDTYFSIRNDISDEINRFIESRGLIQRQAVEMAGISQSRMSQMQCRIFSIPSKPGVETVSAWNMLEALMNLGAHLTISVDSYGKPGEGGVTFQVDAT